MHVHPLLFQVEMNGGMVIETGGPDALDPEIFADIGQDPDLSATKKPHEVVLDRMLAKVTIIF